MTQTQSKKRVVVEPALHKKLKLLAVEHSIDLQDLVAIALNLFSAQPKTQIGEILNGNQT